jgi:hypothetical protein
MGWGKEKKEWGQGVIRNIYIYIYIYIYCEIVIKPN